MSKKSWHLDRRTFLKGAGVGCALPYLEAMGAGKIASVAPKRLCYLYFPNGVSNPSEENQENTKWRWFPKGEGEKYENNHSLSPLNSLREDMSIFGGLSHPRSRELMGHIAGDTWLTGGDLRTTYNNNISVDQVAATSLGKATRYKSFNFSADGGVGYKSRASTLSYNAQGLPLPSEHKHRQIFERYFSPNGMGSTAERKKKIQQGKRMVDLIMGSSQDLKRNLGKNDQVKVDEYLHTLDSVEGQLERNEAWLETPLKKVDTSHLNFDLDPAKNAETYVRSMYDLMVLGYQMDLTRVMTFMIAREDGMGFGENYPKLVLGSAKGHHGITHGGDPKIWSRYDHWLSTQLAYFWSK